VERFFSNFCDVKFLRALSDELIFGDRQRHGAAWHKLLEKEKREDGKNRISTDRGIIKTLLFLC
jgi:hypothetical protein